MQGAYLTRLATRYEQDGVIRAQDLVHHPFDMLLRPRSLAPHETASKMGVLGQNDCEVTRFAKKTNAKTTRTKRKLIRFDLCAVVLTPSVAQIVVEQAKKRPMISGVAFFQQRGVRKFLVPVP